MDAHAATGGGIINPDGDAAEFFTGEKTWYQHAPCSEYEFDPSIPDTIIID